MHTLIVGGSDAGIAAALRVLELEPGTEVTVLLADSYPNFSICGIPYLVSGEVGEWSDLAHRTATDLQAAGMNLQLSTVAREIDVAGSKVRATGPGGVERTFAYDALVLGTGAMPILPAIRGLAGAGALGPEAGVHLLHSMEDTFEVLRTLDSGTVERALIVGGGYIGLEMAEALTTRGLFVLQVEQLPEVLPTVDAELGAMVHAELSEHAVDVRCGLAVRGLERAADPRGRLLARCEGTRGEEVHFADMVLVVVGVRPDTELAAAAGAELGVRGAIKVDRRMGTGLPRILAAGDCVETHHRLLGTTYLPLGTTAHKQGRVAGENALGGSREFAGSLGTQVVKVFDQVVARTGLREGEGSGSGFDPVTVAHLADDHKAYYPGSRKIAMRITGDRRDGRMLGLQLFGHRNSEVAKRVDVAATAIHNGMAVDAVSDLDLSYTPPLGSPWDAVQAAAQAWVLRAGGR